MTKSSFEVVRTYPEASRMTSAAVRSRNTIVAGGVTMLALIAAAGIARSQVNAFLSALDDEKLTHATRALDSMLKAQREQLVAEVAVLAEDNRIRATVLAPTFDSATVQDVVDDLRKGSGATLLAVIDGSGKVKVVSGTGVLRDANLGASSAVREAYLRPTSDVWSLADQVQVVALAPIRSRDQVPALLVKGMPLGNAQLATVGRILDVAGAIFVGDRVVASNSQSPSLDEAFRVAIGLAEGTQAIETARGQYLVRLVRTGTSATGTRVAWLVPQHHHADQVRMLSMLLWIPAALAAVLFGLLIWNCYRVSNGGTQ